MSFEIRTLNRQKSNSITNGQPNAPTCAGFVVLCVDPIGVLSAKTQNASTSGSNDDLTNSSSKQMSRKYSGRGVIRTNSNEPHVLLVSTHKNVWGFPKGKRNSKELYDICAFRELKEETGLTHTDIHPVDMETFCLHEVTDKGTPSVKLYVATTDRLITPIVQDVDELRCAKWMPVSGAYNILTLKNRQQILRDALAHLKIDIDTYLKQDNIVDTTSDTAIDTVSDMTSDATIDSSDSVAQSTVQCTVQSSDKSVSHVATL